MRWKWKQKRTLKWKLVIWWPFLFLFLFLFSFLHPFSSHSATSSCPTLRNRPRQKLHFVCSTFNVFDWVEVAWPEIIKFHQYLHHTTWWRYCTHLSSFLSSPSSSSASLSFSSAVIPSSGEGSSLMGPAVTGSILYVVCWWTQIAESFYVTQNLLAFTLPIVLTVWCFTIRRIIMTSWRNTTSQEAVS